MRICDTHNDFLTELGYDSAISYINDCKEKGVQRIAASFFSTFQKEEEIEYKLKICKEILPQGLLHIEDLWWIKNEEKLKFLVELSPFSASLTWNNDNILAGGSKGDGKLTDFGRKVVCEMLKNGIVVDLAHLNRRSFFEVADLVKDNLYCSHTCFCGVKRHKRNLTDRQVDRIIESDGFVGLFFYDKCLKKGKGKFTVNDIADSIKYFVDRWGYDNIGIGSDFYGIENYPEGLKDYSDFDNLASALARRGLSPLQIDKILFLNFERFLSKLR